MESDGYTILYGTHAWPAAGGVPLIGVGQVHGDDTFTKFYVTKPQALELAKRLMELADH